MATDLLVGLGISGFFLFAGTASWYHPTLFLYLFDEDDVDPWPQLLFTPAAYIGAWFLMAMVGGSLSLMQAIVCFAVGAAILARHERNPRGDDDIWPSRTVATAILAVGGLFALAALLTLAGVLEPL